MILLSLFAQSADEFQTLLNSTDQTLIAFFFTDSDPFLQQLPSLINKSPAPVYSINCSQPSSADYCARFNFNSFPQLLSFNSQNNRVKTLKKELSVQNALRFISENVKHNVKKFKKVEEFMNALEYKQIVVIQKDTQIKPLWIKLSQGIQIIILGGFDKGKYDQLSASEFAHAGLEIGFNLYYYDKEIVKYPGQEIMKDVEEFVLKYTGKQEL
ncbi:Thioredoxin-like_superfamily [Hexamita inflata]|uniref:Thioredoxin-like superfamily n=1 Tax=Hexamita inflata TaxID=28002 RepID=A0AA86Q3Q2_9EUKA|nr:Thioredoxin-like superfamily [Hexamita inflata]